MLYTQKQSSCFLSSSINLHSHSTPPLLCSPASFPSFVSPPLPSVSPLLLLLASCQLCIALNNIEHVRVFLGHLPRTLDWQGVERAMEESCGVEGKEQVYKALNGQLFNMDLDLQREAKRLIALLTDKVNSRSPLCHSSQNNCSTS